MYSLMLSLRLLLVTVILYVTLVSASIKINFSSFIAIFFYTVGTFAERAISVKTSFCPCTSNER